jgi:hypothetical protein
MNKINYESELLEIQVMNTKQYILNHFFLLPMHIFHSVVHSNGLSKIKIFRYSNETSFHYNLCNNYL